MQIVFHSIIAKYTKNHVNVKSELGSWYYFVQEAQWKNESDVKADYPSVFIQNGGRYIFKMRNDDCRLVVDIDFLVSAICIRFLGTPSECSKIDTRVV